jgi:hypothetical protein
VLSYLITFKDDGVGSSWNIFNHWKKTWKLKGNLSQKRKRKLKEPQIYFNLCFLFCEAIPYFLSLLFKFFKMFRAEE